MSLSVGSSVICNWKNSDTQIISKMHADFSLALIEDTNSIQCKIDKTRTMCQAWYYTPMNKTPLRRMSYNKSMCVWVVEWR